MALDRPVSPYLKLLKFFCLSTYMAIDLGEVVYEIMALDRLVSPYA